MTVDCMNQKKEDTPLSQNERKYFDLYQSACQQVKEMQLLERLRNAIARELGMSTIAQIITEGIAESNGYPMVSLYMLQEEKLILQHQVGYSDIHDQIPISQGVEGNVVRSGKPFLLKDSESDPGFSDSAKTKLTKISVPVFDQQKVVGVMTIETTKGKWLSEADLHLLVAINENVSNAYWRARIYSKSLQTKDALDKERRLLRTVIDNIPDQIFARDRECRFTLSNLKDAQTMGVSNPDQLLGKCDLDFYPQDLALKYIKDDKRVIENGQSLIDIVEPSVDKDGKERWIMTTKVPLRDNEDQIIGLVGIARDITKQIQDAKALEDAKQQAEDANKAKSTFLANMSHEIRTPLNAILGFSQLLLREPDLSSQQRHQLTTIHHSGEHLLQLINDILEISKIEAGRAVLNFTPFDLSGLLRDLQSMFQVRMEEKHLAFDVIIEDRVPHFIITDESKLRQILINLIGNAVKFTKQGRIRCIVDANHIEEDNWRLIIQIEDSGIGITADDIEKLFQVFQQAPGNISEGGTGLGLAISQRFASLLNGHIQVTSEPGIGSCFTLDIAIKEDKSTQPERKIPRLKINGIKDPATTYRVLIVDDVYESRELLSSFLTQVGFEIMEATNGKEALIAWENWIPHLIIMDIRMPVMNGLEATTRIRNAETDLHVPIIAATASAFEEEKHTIIDTGMNGYLRKPIEEQELFNVIGECLGIEFTYFPDMALSDNLTYSGEATSFPASEFDSIPQELVEKMTAACTSADLDSLLDVVEQINSKWPRAANWIQELADKLKYDDILGLLHGRS